VTAFLALLRRDDDWTGYLWFVVFVVVPLLARLFKWLFTRLGLLREGEAWQAETERRERLARAREERKQAESEGEDLWRKLARGEELAVPAPAPPAPTRASETLERGTSELSLESEEEPAPLSVLGEVTEASEAPEVSLEREEEPAALATLATPVALAPVQFEETPGATRQRGFRLGRGDLRRAILLSEVLGPPVSERPLRA